MRWNRIVVKLIGAILLLFLVVLLPLGFVIDRIFSGFYYRQVQEEIDGLSSRYAQSVAVTRDLMTVNMIEMMANFSDVKLYIADVDGRVIASSGVPGISTGSFISDEEIQALYSGNSIFKEYKAPAAGEHFLVAGKPILNGNAFYGGVFVLSSIEGINQSVAKIRKLLILSGIGAFFLALGFTYVLSRRLSDPLLQMERATRQIAKGDLHARVKVASGDEIGSLAKAINDLAKDLQRYRDTRSEFFANISHELRTPITYLEGYAKVLKEGLYQTEKEKEQYLDIIYQESLRLCRLIHDLFELSKMEEGKISLNLEWIDLREVLENSVRKASLKVKAKGIGIHLTTAEDLPLIWGDGLRMEQIFINLMDNAIRYTKQGRITVEAGSVNSGSVRVSIEDTGIGIPETELPYIFERFYRVEKSRSREHGGTGLGLAIVKKLVELQGGRIRVISELGKGTRFEIQFPVKHDGNPEEARL
ncbi:sensor histidine kinase [Effusibacillus lacus]|uniref:histidine kinase n=1 Tax=Effusibacillus lacus TaxID=1348429 RepID=A0A292YT46_9BACL|nr:HAMP domain-containing sensor histidine kinase [Effusibacillus lacus]TCS74987.1 signal transduction histidine kinase [Effusibacillus lacus]GAX91655.1 two-component sensor histidine kinase [Effusibacillus lacus]